MSRRRGGGHGGGHASSERWLLTYADLITLLLVFFVVLYSMSSPEVHKYDELMKSLTSAFHVTSGGSHSILPPGSTHPIPGGSAVIPEMQALMHMQEQIEHAIAKEDGDKAAEMVSTSLNQRGLVVSLASSAFFDSGDAEIRPEALPVLRTIGQQLAKTVRPVMVEGHTDNTPIHTYRYPSNWELSTARASAVVRYFITNSRLNPRRLSAAGYGEYYPLVANDTPQHRAKNRRVDIVILRSDLKGQRPAGQF